MTMPSGHRIAGLVAATLLGGLSLWSPARADQIYIQQSGTSPAGGDPNLLTNPGAFTLGVAGSATLQDPLLVIVGVYDGNGTPSISFSGCAAPSACPSAALGTYGLTTDSATFTSTSSGSAFDQLGLSSGGSENWTNWSGADMSNGFAAPTGYTLYAFALDTSLTSSTPITIDESGAADGSFVIAYACKAGTGSDSGCGASGDISQTVFTNTGLIDTNVPEPGSLALCGAALAGLALVRLRTRRRGPF